VSSRRAPASTWFLLLSLQFVYTVCTSGFQCDGTRCIPFDWRCDGHLDCADHSDEVGCGECNSRSASSMSTSAMSATTTFGKIIKGPSIKGTLSTKSSLHCGERRCMSASHICDGIMDCPWGQDERYCRKQTFETVMVPLSLVKNARDRE